MGKILRNFYVVLKFLIKKSVGTREEDSATATWRASHKRIQVHRWMRIQRPPLHLPQQHLQREISGKRLQ